MNVSENIKNMILRRDFTSKFNSKFKVLKINGFTETVVGCSYIDFLKQILWLGTSQNNGIKLSQQVLLHL